MNESINGHEYVDLGLPSGTRWATCNVGAGKPEDFGNYYAWGETGTKDSYKRETYKYANLEIYKLTKYCCDPDRGSNGFTDHLTTLQSVDDAATLNWGGGWRMPTEAEWKELIDNTTSVWTLRNGVSGRLLTASNGNSIFLPAAGYIWDGELNLTGNYGFYWSSSLDMDNQGWALYFRFGSDGGYKLSEGRYCGHSVRAVCSLRQN